MGHVTKSGIRYIVERSEGGGARVEARVEPSLKLLSGVTMPPEAASALLGASAAVIDVGELRAEIRAAVVADLQAEHDAEIEKMREQIGARDEALTNALAEPNALRAQIANLEAALQPAGEVVPITAAKKPAQRRKPAAKK